MPSLALARTPEAVPTRNPFLDALVTTQYGRMTVTLPDGERLVFTGNEFGANADWQVHDMSVFDSFIGRGEMGMADTYIDGQWDSSDLESFITFFLQNAEHMESFFHGRPLYALWLLAKERLAPNSITRSRRNVIAHYDLGNEFYRLWLDDSMTYSCALFEGASGRTLEQAQSAKYARILDKLNAKPGDHILEIGCGWGGFAEAAARRDLRVTAITLADTQAEFARERMKNAGLDHLVDIRLIDYREIEGEFDHIVSIGMFEHVGKKYWRTYFGTIKRLLKPGGTAMVQSITLDENVFNEQRHHSGFIEHYIFPGGQLPTKRAIHTEAGNAGLLCREIYAFGQDYAMTLSHWLQRFDQHLETIRRLGYEARFVRLWRLYLSSCIASFKTKRTDVVQVELKN